MQGGVGGALLATGISALFAIYVLVAMMQGPKPVISQPQPIVWKRASALLDSDDEDDTALPASGLTERVITDALNVSREELYRYSANDTEGFVYFILDQDDMIKIGFSTNPRRRISTLQTGFSYRLRTLACVPGTKSMEAFLHYHFAQERNLGEWFEASPRLRDFIAHVEKEMSDYTPPWLLKQQHQNDTIETIKKAYS